MTDELKQKYYLLDFMKPKNIEYYGSLRKFIMSLKKNDIIQTSDSGDKTSLIFKCINNAYETNGSDACCEVILIMESDNRNRDRGKSLILNRGWGWQFIEKL